jgi:hypothetical protein
VSAPRRRSRDEDAPPATGVSGRALSDGERRAGLVLGIFAGAAFIALSGGRALFLVVGLAMAGALVLASWRRSRIGAAFAAFATTFGPWSFAAVFGAPYAIYAFWILSRGTRLRSPEPSAGTPAARRGGGRGT